MDKSSHHFNAFVEMTGATADGQRAVELQQSRPAVEMPFKQSQAQIDGRSPPTRIWWEPSNLFLRNLDRNVKDWL